MSDAAELIGVPVVGGELVAGVWRPRGDDRRPERTLLAFHGISASHVSWVAVARALPEYTVIAPDLRGRGGSRALVGPFGMAQHAADGAAVLDALGLTGAVDVVGHSMGGFVALRFAELFPDRVASLTLVDGGIPLAVPDDVPFDELIRATLGPALARLSVEYPSVDAYRDFWRAHPALAEDWNDDVRAYVDYDLVGEAPALRSAASADAVLGDAVEQGAGTVAERPWERVTRPITFLRAPRGLLNAAPLYEPEYVAAFAAAHPNVSVIEVPDINHYTIVMAQRGAEAVAGAIRAAAAGAGSHRSGEEHS